MSDLGTTPTESAIAPIVRRLSQDRRGGPAAEFALLLPIMATIFVGIIQYGSLFYTYHAMSTAARTAVRAIAIGSQNATTAAATARDALPPWVPKADYAVVIVDGAAGSQVSAQITAPAAKAAVIPYLPMPANIVAEVIMVKEG
jgi:Flp pilus assembly protein TadG